MSARRPRLSTRKHRRHVRPVVGQAAPRIEQLEDRLLLSLLGIGDLLEPPEVNYDATGHLTYTASTQAFDGTALPVSFSLIPGQRPITIKAPRDFQLHIQVDNTGALIGGVAGDDLMISGQIDINRDGVNDYDGVLLTGEVVQFGYLEGGLNDQYDFRLIPTGGDLMSFFVGKDIGLDMRSPNSTFAGSFAVDFAGECHGVCGVIDMLPATASLAGMVFVDADNDGVADEGEAGIAGTNVALVGTDYRGQAVSLAAVTGEDGAYTFDGLLAGTYSITETQPDGYLDDAAGVNSYANITLASGEAASGLDFGEVLPGSLAGVAFLDANDNGVLDDVEGGLAGVAVALTGTDDRGQAVSLTAVTGEDGAYAFAGLRPGSYIVTETQPDGYLDNAAGVNDYAVAVASGTAASGLSFGEVLPGSLAGIAFHDANDNGVLDDGEGGIAGVTVALTGTDDRGQAVSLTALTGEDGAYAFAGLRPGSYGINETQPDGLLDSLGAMNSYAGLAVTSGTAASGFNFGEIIPVSLAGAVYLDANDNGVLDDAEAGIAGVTVALTGTNDLGEAMNLTAVTGADGAYAFAGLRPGTYSIAEAQPDDLLDNVAGVNSYSVTAVSGAVSGGYDFGEIEPGSLAGFVFEDFNNDGQIDFNDTVIEGVVVTLTGVDDRGQAVSLSGSSDADGVYSFTRLRPGDYTIAETQPAGYADGIDTLGTAGGTVGEDSFSGIAVAPGVVGLNYNFAERPQAGSAVTSGQTATIGFWQNKNGQGLVKALNGSPTATQLGNWLAATFPNMYAALAGMTNAQVAQFYYDAFKAKVSKAGQSGPAKFDCQVMATAFAVYATNASLAGDAATRYGFRVTEYGVGIATFNIGDNGLAFGVADYTTMTVMDILLATNSMSVDGRIYDMDALLRRLANEVYSAINEAGHI